MEEQKRDWQRLWEIFHEARAKESSERAAFLNQACGSDEPLRQEILSLLEAEQEAESLIQTRGMVPQDLTFAPAEETISEDYEPGTVLSDRFEILQLLGRGGMGTVYKALDRELSRPVALKFLHTVDLRFTRRFQLEARFQARIDHEHICKVFEVGDIGNRHFIAMQFIPGRTLQEVAAEMTLTQKVRLMQQVCNGVHAAHKLGVIHRDIKPTNILVIRTESGEWTPYVTDFGLAREFAAAGVTDSGMVMGTASYMSPEQARGEIRKLDRRCDVYSIGATLYELLCGKPPFEGQSSVDVLTKVVNEDPLPLRQHNTQIPAELESIVEKCLQKEPERRYDSAAALSEDLGRFLSDEPILARPVTWRYRAVKKVKKNPIISGLLALTIFAVIGFGGFAGWTWWRAQMQATVMNEFEQEIRFMEDTARHAYRQPAHNILKEEAVVEQRLKAIESRIQESGSIAIGPGNFALGRGYMALYRYPEARKHLETSWEEYKIPRVAFALGVTLALLYQKEFERADRIPDQNAREEKKKQIEVELKQPALQFIAAGRSAIEAEDYVKALIAFLEKRYEETLSKTRAAFQLQPWLYEAKKLEADTLRAMGNEKRNTGDAKGAIELYQKAEAQYREAVRGGASYWLAYGSLCALGHDWTTLMMYQTGFPDESVLKKSVEACNSSLQINPDRPEAYIAKSALKGAWGSYEMGRGLDPTASFNESIESARSALKWDWVRFAAYTNMGVAYSRRAAFEIEHGKEATESLNQAIECARHAVRLNPAAPFRNNLGISLAIKAGYEIEQGRNADALRDEAIREFQEAVKIAPDFESGYNSLGEIHLEKAQSAYDRSEDPNALCEISIKNLQKSIELNPTFFPAITNYGDVYKLKALHNLDQGIDPGPNLDQAVAKYQKTLELDEKNADAVIRLADIYRIRSAYDSAQQKDPSAAIQMAHEQLQKAKELAAGHPELPRAYADLYLVSAKWKELHSSKSEAGKEIRAGLRYATESLQKHPRKATLHATKGSFLLLQSRLESSRKSAAEAEASFQEAFRLNPALAKKYKQ